MPLISVVIPFFNSHATLRETLDSLAAQTFRDFEIVLVDDGSTAAEAQDCLTALPAAVTLVRQENRGLPAARNAGIRVARGELILPLDADDMLAPSALAQLVAALDLRPDADLAFSWTRRFGEEDGISQMAFNRFEQLFLNEAPYCMLFKRRIWEAAGGYDEEMRFGHEDWDFGVRLLAQRATAIVLPEPLFRYRVSSTGLMRSTRLDRLADLWRMLRGKHPDLYRWDQLREAWRNGRRQPSVWPLPLVALWGLVLMAVPSAVFNPVYRALVLRTRGLRDRMKMRRHGAG